jgi:hypothetical protein
MMLVLNTEIWSKIINPRIRLRTSTHLIPE